MPLSRSHLHPIATPHPVVMIITLVVVAVLIVLMLNPRFHPPVILFVSICVILVAVNSWSRMRRAKSLKQQEKPSGEIFLNIESQGKQKSN
ncbi:MAG TPA: hypothetical protein VKZ53_13790 [Candidatus Angelobacter sp.]|nr:hypothetical protein [Candidatus Angelobacter sp.]